MINVAKSQFLDSMLAKADIELIDYAWWPCRSPILLIITLADCCPQLCDKQQRRL